MQNKKEKNHSLSEVKDAHSFTVIDLLILKDESMSDSFCLREEEGARDNTGGASSGMDTIKHGTAWQMCVCECNYVCD